MSDSSERAAEILRGPDGERIYLFLLDHANKLARRYGWRVDKTLPQAASPQSVVHDIIVKVLQGQRTWEGNSETALVLALQGMIRSDMGHLFDKLEFQLTEPIDDASGEKTDQGGNLVSPQADPHAEILQKERKSLEDVAYELILKSVEDNDELSAVAIALHDNDSPAAISSATGIPVDRVYQLLRTLYRKARCIPLPLVERKAKGKKK